MGVWFNNHVHKIGIVPALILFGTVDLHLQNKTKEPYFFIGFPN